MRQFVFAIGALAFCVLAWLAIFDSMANRMPSSIKNVAASIANPWIRH
jgi:hypothetical protein